MSELQEAGITPGFTVAGNVQLVLRESLLPRVLDMGARTIEQSLLLFGGLWGPFCLECVIDRDLNIYVFEISARIVAGTNLYTQGSPYSYLQYGPGMSMGRRIAMEIRKAIEQDKLDKVIS